MNKLRHLLALTTLCVLLPLAGQAQVESPLQIDTPNGWIELDSDGIATVTNYFIVRYAGAILTADRGRVNQRTGEVEAEGRVRIQRDDMIWAGERIKYNFKTRTMETELFRTGRSPVFTEGESVAGGGTTNAVYTARNAYVTTDDIARPNSKIRASSITIYPGQRVVARNATLYVGGMPVFYFPYYSHNLDDDSNHFILTPGYRSKYGAFLLGGYRWFLNDQLDGLFHLDYRAERGVGVGPDFNFHLGRWGEGEIQYYYLNDREPGTNSAGFTLPDDRHRFHFSYDAMPWTNFFVKSRVRYQSDERVLRDYFEGEHRANPQPGTFVEVNKLWDNFSLDFYTRARVNDYFETAESLPEIRLTGFRQQLGNSPLFYESETSAGYYRRLFAETNGLRDPAMNYEAARADSYHQLTLPQTFFGWLNFIPRVGGRFSHYTRAHGDGATTDDEDRGVFNTGAEVNFKASRLWTAAENRLLDVQGLRHIVQPSVNYVYVPRPNVRPAELPQFSYETPSLRLLPIEYPDYNAIDAIDSQNVIRFGLMNKLQTKRDGQLEDLLRWDLYTDWRLDPRTNQNTFADLWSDLIFRPRSWLTLESQTRFDLDTGDCRMAFHNVTFQPNDVWSWSVGHWYLHEDFSGLPTSLGAGSDLITSSAFYRLNENWAFRAAHHYEIKLSRLQEQYYTVYRDFRNWTGALTFRVRDNGDGEDDYTVAFTFSLKAMPRYKLGSDTIRPYQLIGN